MKRLEGEVLESLLDLGGQEALSSLERHTVDPHQFLGLEINPRAAAIAELVIWLGYLQWHFRTKGSAPSEPILRDFKNIKVKDAVLTWDDYPLPKVVECKETYPNARKPDWPDGSGFRTLFLDSGCAEDAHAKGWANLNEPVADAPE